MKKAYQQPQIKVVNLSSQDLIATSNIETASYGDDIEPDPEPTGLKLFPVWHLIPIMALALFSCSSSDEVMDTPPSLQGPQPDLVKMTCRASMEGDDTTEQPNSRAAFTGVDAHGKVHAQWQENDKINILYSGQSDLYKDPFTLDKNQGFVHGVFTGSASYSAAKFTALYPYQSEAEYNGTEVSNVVLPTWQTATAGSFDPYAGLLMGEAENPKTSPLEIDMNFKYVCSFIELAPTFDCKSIIVSTRSSNEYLSGNFYLRYNEIPERSNDALKMTKLVNQVTLQGPIVANQTYYIAVLPGTYNSGIRVTCVGNDGKMMTKERSSAVTLERGKIHRMTAFLSNPASAEVDGVDLGTGDGILWATRNLGATAPQEFGDKYVWGESKPLYSYTSDSDYGVLYQANDPGQSDYDPAGEDAATLQLGSAWRMPTLTEMQNLLDKCTWTYTGNYNDTGYAGYIVEGNSNQIFLPISNDIAYYWTSNITGTNANSLELNHSVPETGVISRPGYKSSLIRPVRTSN